MEWYSLRTSTDEKVTGTHPQTDGMRYGYDLRKADSIWNIPNLKLPDFEPDLDYFVLDKKAKLTDVISTGLISASGFILNDRVKNIFDRFKLPAHKYFPAKVMCKKEIHDNYYWFHLLDDCVNNIDFENSKFIRRDPIFKEDFEKLNISNKEELFSEKQKSSLKHIFPERLTINNSNNLNFLFFNSFWINYFVSAEILDALETEKCTGFDHNEISFKMNVL